MLRTTILILLSVCWQLSIHAQLSDSQYQKIDALFQEWNRPNHPGGAVGIMMDGKLVFSKAYGLASLEYLVPNTTETIFNTGSVSKQFTAMGIVVLDLQGKLSVEDDIRKYLPELPDFGETITISHMLHHTSGMRSLHAMLEMAGWRGDDARTNKDLNRFMLMQKDLNFTPGSEYLYCNTGYMLMVNIIEKVTGEKFPKWMKANVFEPLGLYHTYVEDEYDRIVPQNATSYYGRQSFSRAVEYWGYVGSGNMHSTTGDLLKWLQNFHTPQDEWAEAFEKLQTTDPFNDGTPNTYAYGVTLAEEKGNRLVTHGGAIGGFRAIVGSFPDQKLDIALLTNFSASGTRSKMGQIADLLLPNMSPEESDSGVSVIQTVEMSREELESFTGAYWYEKDAYARHIVLENDTLRYVRGENNQSNLVPVGENLFQMIGVDVKLMVKFAGNIMEVTVDNDPPYIHTKYSPIEPTPDVLSTYTGSFYSPELETTYQFYMKDGKLMWHHPRWGDEEMALLKPDVLEGGPPISIIKVQRGKRGKIEGIRVSNGRVRDLWFEKR